MEKGMENMTKFDKELFTWDGMYLMYRGDYVGSKLMEEVHPNCHPSWVGKTKPAFIARFKYGAKPWKSWVNCLVDNYTVEEYLKVAEETSPLQAVWAVGYSGKGRYNKNKTFVQKVA
jgi:hypothetical protein